MNPAIGAFVGVSKQTEMLLMTVLALWVNIFDMAIFEISSNLDQVWNVEIDKDIFNPNAEYVIRMLLSGVVLIRTFTLHLYIAFLIAVFWPVCFGTRPTLMLPWLVVSAIKNLGTGLVSIGTGGYTCMIYGPLRPACIRFLLSQLIDLSPSFYMWFVGLSLYCDLKKPKSVSRLQVKAMEDQELNMALRRRKVKSMIDEDILRQQFESRSFQKKYLGTSAVEVNEFVNPCSYDNLKNKFSRSLDSLLDVLTVQTELLEIEDSEPLDIDSASTLQQKTAKLLGISMDEIDYIKQTRQTRTDFPVYPVQPQKKTQTISLINSRYESPAKLLPETSLYTPPNVKPIRVTKSELKSAKDFTKTESEFIQSVAEKEMHVHDLTQDESFESLAKLQMQMAYPSTNSSFTFDVANDTVIAKDSNLSSKKASGSKEYGREYSNKNRDKYSRKEDRGKFEDVPIEIPTKYKFFNTMSDKSHYLLDEHSFFFDKDSLLKKKEIPQVESVYAKRKRSIDQNQNQNPPEEKQRRLNAPATDVLSNAKTRFKDNIMNKKMPLDGKSENKTSKSSLKKMKEDVINKKILKQSEKSQAIKKKIATTKKMPSTDYSNIPVLYRNIKGKNGYYNLDKSKLSANSRRDMVNKNQKVNKLYTIQENKDIAEKNNKVTEENKSNVSTVLNKEKEKATLFKEEKKNENISSEEEKEALKVVDDKEENKNNTILLKKEKSIISVTAEVERLNQKDIKISPKNDSFKIGENTNNTSTSNQSEILSKTNYLRSTQYGIPVPFLSLKHSLVRMTPSQKEVLIQEAKTLPKQENKSLFNNPIIKTSQALSEKLLQILKEKTKSKTDKICVEDIFKEKVNKTEQLQTVNNNEFEFTATIDEKAINLPVKSSSRNKQLEFHFKEKITKTKENKMEDLFKKKTVSERKESRTTDKEKLGFPSYFSNKINRMITDACQIRKKSCKKINLFIKVPANTSSKQRNKLSTIELFRKQSPPKTNLFDIARKLENPPCKGDKCKDRATNLNKNKPISSKIQINLFNTDEAKSKKETSLFYTGEVKNKKDINLFCMDDAKNQKALLENLLISDKSNSISSSKTSAHSNDELQDKTTNKTDVVQSVSKEKTNLADDLRHNSSLISSFISFKPNENDYIEEANTSHKVEEPMCVTKTKSSISTSADTKEAQFRHSFVNDAECVKKTESLNELSQNSNISAAAQKTILPTILQNRTCKKLSEQAMNKIISITKTDNLTEEKTTASNQCSATDVKKSSCKRLSEHAINKIISLTNTRYSNFSCSELSTYVTDSKLNAPIVYGTSNCKKLSDFAINKLLAITSPKYTTSISIKGKKPNFTILPRTKIVNNQEIIEEQNVLLDVKHSGIPVSITKSENLNHTMAGSTEVLDDFNKVLKTTQSENSNNFHLNESNTPKVSKTKVNRKSSIPVLKTDISICQKSPRIVSSRTKIENKEVKSSDLKCNKSHIIALIEDAINTETINEINTPIRTSAHNIKLIASTNNIFLNNSNSNLVENQNTFMIDAEIKNCKDASLLDSSTIEPSNEIMTTLVENNCKWASQDSISILDSNITNTSTRRTTSTIEEYQNILNIKDKKMFDEIVQINSKNTATETKSESPKEFTKSSKKENLNECTETPQHCVKIFTSGKNERTIQINSHCNEGVLITEAIPTMHIKKEDNICKWTSPNCIQLIPSNNSGPVEEYISISEKEENIFKTKNEKLNCKEKLEILSLNYPSDTNQENNEAIFENSNNKHQAIVPEEKIEKDCKGTSQHCIKLISSTDKNYVINSDDNEEQTNEINTNVIKVNHEHKGNFLLYETAYNTNLPLKETKVCRGTSQHNIKLISSIKHDSSSETNLCHHKKISSETKDDLFIPLKEQKVCKGSSQNYVKLISQSKEEFASNTNVSHQEALSNILKEYQSVPIMKEEKVCKGTSKHKIKLISSYKKNSPNKINLFHTESDNKNNKNENITIIKEEKICEGTLQHSIKLVSSSKNDTQNKTIFILKEQLPKGKEAIPIIKEDCKDNVQKSSTANRPSLQTNVYVNVNTVNGKQNLTVIQKQNNNKKSAQSGSKHDVNLFVKDKTTNTDETITNNLDEVDRMETFRKIISNTIQDYFENDAEKLPEQTDTNLVSTKKESSIHSLIDIKSSEILSSLINKVETTLKYQESNNKEDLFDEKLKCSKYYKNQIDFGCQTSTLSKKVLDNNPIEIGKKLSRTQSVTKSSSAKSYQDLNLQKIAFSLTTNKNSNSKLETKSNNENLLKDEKKDSTIVLHSRSSRNASYVSIHKERLEKAKSLESDLNKSLILHNCAFLEDGYARLYNLLGVKQETFDVKSQKNVDSSFNF